MNLQQRFELKNLLAPELKQSLQILTLTTLDLKTLVHEELDNNPFLEEAPVSPISQTSLFRYSRMIKPVRQSRPDEDWDPTALLTQSHSLQDTLLQQLAILATKDDDLLVGQEIIGNLDDNGYLKVPLDEIANTLKIPVQQAEAVLALIQQFEPAGVAARDLRECLRNQCAIKFPDTLLIQRIIDEHLEDLATKKIRKIAESLEVTHVEVEACIIKIQQLDPKPGRNYSDEKAAEIIPDIFIEEKDGELEILINEEDIPTLFINKEYKNVLKNKDLPPETREYLRTQLEHALELLRAISRRHSTLRKALEVIVDIQDDGLRNGLSRLRSLTFQEVADRIGMHESTICRLVMNKYVETPQGLLALKDLFPSRIQTDTGGYASSSSGKYWIKELIGAENKEHPLSDEDLSRMLLKNNGLKIARRTVTKYREELKILSSSLRRESPSLILK